MKEWQVPFTRPDISGLEERNVIEALRSGALAGGGRFTAQCHQMLREITSAHAVLLTQSCTSALEMAALLVGVGPGDEVILPSFTFVSTANAFVLRGATPVFVDVDPSTMNIDPAAIENAVTEKTRVIAPVHYAGVACDMDAIMSIAEKHGLYVIEDAAQGLQSDWRDRHLGTFGDFGALSFHNTKNISSGEGGALLINNDSFRERAEILWEKGTNRSRFLRGEIDKYSWVDIGSSFLPSELTAALLSAQLERASEITQRRLVIWRMYDERLRAACSSSGMRFPHVPEHAHHNAHMYYIIARDEVQQHELMQALHEKGIQAVFHYVPLHSSVAARKFSRQAASLPVTESTYARLIRLPLWSGMSDADVNLVIDGVLSVVGKQA